MELNLFQQIFLKASGSPHGYCLLWQTELIYLHVIADFLIASAYLAIPVTIYIYIRKKEKLISRHLFWLFAGFIVACASTHLMGILVIWQPYYYLQSVLLGLTAIISVMTAFALAKQMPILLALPTTAELQELNQKLQSEVERRVVAEEELQRLNKSLEENIAKQVEANRKKDHMLIQQSRLASMGEMIGNIAHQWRQPLNALSLVLINIADAHEYKELTDEYLNKQISNGTKLIQNMSSTIDDFRNFFKSEHSAEIFNLSSCINDALMIVGASFKNHNINLQVELDESLTSKGYPGQYRQVILNLLANAKNAFLENAVSSGKIQLRLEKKDNQACFYIEDNAGGISTDIIDKIFDPYFTTRTEGTGLGLYMSKTIIEKNMHGKISCENKADGAMFYIITALAD